MFNRIYVLLAIMFVPLVAIGVSYKIANVDEAKWREMIQDPPPNLPRQIIGSETFGQ